MTTPTAPSRSLRMSRLPAEQFELRPLEDEQDHGQHHGQRACHAKGLWSERASVDSVDHDVRRLQRERTALCEYEDEREHLQRADHAGQEYEPRHWPEQRHGDAPETAPGSRAIDAGGIEVRLRDRVETTEEHQHLPAHVHPDGYEHQREERGVRIAQPIEAAQAERT